MKNKEKRYLNCKYLDAGMDGMLCSMSLFSTCKEFNGEKCLYCTPKNKMKDKEKQIEEMKDIVHNLWDKLNQDAITTDDIIDALYNSDCRIVKKDSVVLSKDNYNRLKRDSELYEARHKEKLKLFAKAYNQGSKETAEKIFNKLWYVITHECGYQEILDKGDLINVAEQFGVEIKEN